MINPESIEIKLGPGRKYSFVFEAERDCNLTGFQVECPEPRLSSVSVNAISLGHQSLTLKRDPIPLAAISGADFALYKWRRDSLLVVEIVNDGSYIAIVKIKPKVTP